MKKKTEQPIIWQESLVNAVERLPLPDWLIYGLIFLLSLLFLHWVVWAEGSATWGTFVEDALYNAIWLPFVFILAQVVRGSSSRALERFRKSLSISDSEYDEVRSNFLHMPASTGWVLTILAVVIVVLLYWGTETGSTSTSLLFSLLNYAYYLLILTVGFFAFGSVIHQLRWIRHLYSKVDGVDLLHLGPITAFSDLTLRMASPFILANILSYLTNVVLVADPNWVDTGFYLAINTLVGTAAVVYPVWGIHTRIAAEKEKAIAENSARINRIRTQLHKALDSGKLGQAPDHRQAISALLEERDIVSKASTWPWETGNLRGFFSALLLPLALWFIQGLLSNVVAF